MKDQFMAMLGAARIQVIVIIVIVIVMIVTITITIIRQAFRPRA